MKKLFAALSTLALLFTTSLFAQAEEPETLFGNGDIEFGGYGGPEVKFTNFNNDFGVLVGGRAGIIVNSVFTVGVGGYGLVTSHPVDDYYVSPNIWDRTSDTNAYLRMGYGGLHLGFIVEPNKIVHITAGVLIGAGGAMYTSAYMHNVGEFDDHLKTFERSAFFIAEPQIGAELNLLKFMRMEVSASYRFISGLQLPNTENKDLSGFSGNVMFKFGKF
ncbi:MAG: outer membrane beta-barrel protein [Candidatus Kapabacteria bacterium]|nr:outer membrane beta-barrel protein [Ignavibacteriota bacterium]MCW5886003.1 outer membrane beta-barrel protein [Candidatus Kapabacteria bacterium]